MSPFVRPQLSASATLVSYSPRGRGRLRESSVVQLPKVDSTFAEEAVIARQIVESIRQGSREAEGKMVARYSRGLRYLLARRLGDDERARDLLQETFCIAIEKLRRIELENPERLAGYLRGIAVRVAQNAARKKVREPLPVDNDLVTAMADQAPSALRRVAAEEAGVAVRKVLDELPQSRDRELLLRLYVYDQDREEICRALGLSRLHFNRVLYRAKARLKKLLEEMDPAMERGSGDES